MPLNKSPTREAVSENIKTEKAAGRPQKQAVAIALNTARRAGAKFSMGGMVKAGSPAVSAPCRDSKTLTCK